MTLQSYRGAWIAAAGAALLLLTTSGTFAKEPLKPEPYYSSICKNLARRFPREHLTRSTLDDTASSRMWTNYLATIDYERVYFLESDIREFRGHELTLDDEMQAGSTEFAFQVFERLKERMRDRSRYLDQLLAKGFDLQQQESYHWQRKDAPWPANQAEWDELWRKRVKNEYVRLVVARDQAAAATNTVKPEASATTNAPPPVPSPEESIRKRYQQLLTILEDTDADWVFERYLTAFTHAYDPHSDYMAPSTVEDFNIEMKLSLVGIGALLSSEDGAAKIVRLIPGGPADRDKRLQPGDKIIEVADGGGGRPVDILHWPLPKIVKLIRGEKGTKVLLTIIPASDPTGSTTRRIDIMRDEVKLEEQAANSKVRDLKGPDGVGRKLGIVTLPAFYGDMQAMQQNEKDYKSCSRDVAAILANLRRENVDGLILDLRNNGGGSLLEAIRMTGLFISAGPTVQVKERLHTRVLSDTDPSVAYGGPLLVLVNRLSASASEIVAGALQDYGRAIIVGDSKTHGKGTVQSLLEVGRDEKLGSVKVTTASYYRISGSSTQLRGITPDIVIRSPFDFMQLGEESLANPIEWSQIDPARYTPITDTRPVVEELRRRFDKRLATDTRYAAYTQFLGRVEAMNKTEDVPLNLDERKRLARAEKELVDLQTQLSPDGGDSTNAVAKTQSDIVLDESLTILSDLVSLQQQPPAAPGAQAEMDGGSMTRTILEWLQNHL